MDDETATTSGPTFKRVLGETQSMLNQTNLVTGTRRQIFTGALLGTCLVFLATMLGLPQLDTPLTVALYAFAIAIPCLAIEFAVTTYGTTAKTETLPRLFADVFVSTMILLGDSLGAIAAVVGIGAVLAHFSVVVLLVGLATLIFMHLVFWGVGMVAVVRHYRQRHHDTVDG